MRLLSGIVMVLAMLPGQAQLVLPESPLHVGTVPNDRATSKEFEVRNVGTVPVTVKDIKTECACTKGEVSPKTIPAGGAAKLTVTITPEKTMSFRTDKKLTLLTDASAEPAVEVRVTSDIEPEFLLEPAVLELGEVPQSEGVSKTVRFRSNNKDAVELKAVERGPGAANLEVEMRKVKKGEWAAADQPEYDVVVSLKPGQQVGPFEAPVYLRTTNKRVGTYEYKVKGNVVSFYSVTPRVVNLGTVRGGEWYTVMTIEAEEAIEVISATPVNPAAEVRFDGGGSNRLQVQSLVPSDSAGRVGGSIDLRLQTAGKEFSESVRYFGDVAK